MLKKVEYKFKSYCNNIANIYCYTNAQSFFAEHKYINTDKMYNQISD